MATTECTSSSDQDLHDVMRSSFGSPMFSCSTTAKKFDWRGTCTGPKVNQPSSGATPVTTMPCERPGSRNTSRVCTKASPREYEGSLKRSTYTNNGTVPSAH